MKRGSKFVGHSTEIIRQSKIKGPLKSKSFCYFTKVNNIGTYFTMGVIGEICPFRQKIIFQISPVLTILGDSQDIKPYVPKKIFTFSSL